MCTQWPVIECVSAACTDFAGTNKSGNRETASIEIVRENARGSESAQQRGNENESYSKDGRLNVSAYLCLLPQNCSFAKQNAVCFAS